ncbi:hypothetical protein [Candidatus Poseidonia alphae]|uniref:HEAT repeat domain-containing protein n=1 Tax=Candidatus Poseidonia alphae TaxID=1915863 RepID=UPI0030C6F70C
MAGELDRAMGRLKHRDIRTRRRAVRTLVELEDPESLKAFKSLLNDEDSWFVSKALDAYRRWAPTVGLDAVQDLTAHSSLNVRRCGANLLDALGENGTSIAKVMLDDEDSVVRRKAADALLTHGDNKAIEAMHQNANDAIRSLAMRHRSCSKEQLLNGLKDASASVQIEALRALLNRDEAVELSAIQPFFGLQSETVKLFLWMAKHHPNNLSALAEKLGPQHFHDITKHLRGNVDDSSDVLIQTLIETNMHSIIARWLMGKGAQEDELRWDMIGNQDVDIIERSKLLERLLGRANEPDVIDNLKKFMATNPPELLKVACENLSTAANELTS